MVVWFSFLVLVYHGTVLVQLLLSGKNFYISFKNDSNCLCILIKLSYNLDY